jgi:hypothetical protein
VPAAFFAAAVAAVKRADLWGFLVNMSRVFGYCINKNFVRLLSLQMEQNKNKQQNMEHSNPTERRVSFAPSASQEAAAERHKTQTHRPPLRRLIKLEEHEEDDYEPDTPSINKQQQQHKQNQATATLLRWGEPTRM